MRKSEHQGITTMSPERVFGMFDQAVTKEEIELAGDLARRELYSKVMYLLSTANIRRQDIADALGINKSVVSRMLAAPRNMTIENAGRLLRVLGYWLHIDPQPAGQVVVFHGHSINRRSIVPFSQPETDVRPAYGRMDNSIGESIGLMNATFVAEQFVQASSGVQYRKVSDDSNVQMSEAFEYA